ncbi:amino acid adenylation domain-containing protein [Pseudoalteromonas rhizosphaerae]|uniref:Amino acid adenylation domain-containing protein n=1 Tax=Pseudoalteromonas rhizosphaerae TaxID=2518973 RepID=A0ABW8L440_9GAMM
MTGNEVFTLLKEQGVLFEVANGQVNLKLPKGLSDDTKHMLRAHKDVLKAFLLALNSHAQKEPVIKRRSGDNLHLPLSSAQKRLYLIDQMQGGSPHYNMVSTFRVRGEFDISRFESVVQKIITRHGVLRTIYGLQDGEPYQRIVPIEEVAFKVDQFNVSDLPPSAQDERVLHLMSQATQYNFNLNQDVMIRATYIVTGEAEGALALVIHHIASDGWSMDIFTREFAALYMESEANTVCDFPELPIQYADYALWEQSQATQEKLTEQLRYWKLQLEGAPVNHSLPVSSAKTQSEGHSGALVSSEIPKRYVKRLQDIARQHNLTLFTLLHGLLALLLSRFSNSNDIVIGTPVAGRNNKELESLLGFFVNMLTLRVDTRYTQLNEYFEHVRKVNIDAQSNQDVAFDTIVESLGLSGSAASSPLFQILLTLDGQFSAGGESHEAMQLGKIQLEPLELPTLQTKYDLHIDCRLNQPTSAIHWIYNKSLFRVDDISELSTHFAYLVTQIAENGLSSYEKPAALPIMSDSEMQQFINPKHNHSFGLEGAKPLHQLVEQQAALNPDKVAVAWGVHTLSYAKLNQYAEQVAIQLQMQRSVLPGACIGVFATRSAEMVIAILGVLKTGAAYVPLDPAYPQTRIEYMIEQAQITTLLCDDRTISKGVNMVDGAIAVSINSEAPFEPEHDIAGIQRADVKLSDLAYVIFTSGSGGKPKGVMIEHLGVVNTLLHCQDTFAVTPQSTLYQSTSLSFDAATWVIFMALTSGATLRLSSTQDLHAELSHSFDVTHIMMTPSMLETLNAKELEHIDTVIVGGEECKPHVISPWLNARKSVFNAYGPTEASICTSVKQLTSPTCISIGQPNANMKYYVLDENLALVPRGGIGELYIVGLGVARGYLGQPKQIQAAFSRDPFVKDASGVSERMYRTGDLVRVDEEGDTHYLGRLDEQVKIRGCRVELQEVEAQVNTYSGIENSVVKVISTASGMYLAAYVIYEGEQPLVINDLQDYLATHLPNHMLPTYIMELQEFPLTSNGKLDSKALPGLQHQQTNIHFKAPETAVEKQICEILQTLLSIPEVGMTDNFFVLGGTSLLAMKAVHLLNQKLAAGITVEKLLNAADIRGIAKSVSETYRDALTHIKPAPAQDNYPLSTAQSGIFFEYELGRGAVYNVPVLMCFEHQFDPVIFAKALDALVANHPMLRTQFVCIEGEPRQSVLPVGRMGVIRHVALDTEHCTRQQFICKVNEQVMRILQYPLDIYSGEVMQSYFFAQLDGLQVVLLNFSHIAVDGWSIELIKSELKTYYSFVESGIPIQTIEREVEYVDYAYWQQNRPDNTRHLSQQFWQSQLALLNSSNLLTAYKKSTQAINGALCDFEIDHGYCSDIERLAKEHACSEFNVWLAIYAITTTIFANSDIFSVSIDFANRNALDTEKLVGMFVNPLLLIDKIENESSFSGLLNQLSETCNATFKHGDVFLKDNRFKFDNLDSQLLDAHLRHKFAYQEESQLLDDNADLMAQQEGGIEFMGLKYDLSFVLNHSAGRIVGQILYNQDVFHERQADKLKALFKFVLGQVTQEPTQCITVLKQRWQQQVSHSFKNRMGGFKAKRKVTS